MSCKVSCDNYNGQTLTYLRIFYSKRRLPFCWKQDMSLIYIAKRRYYKIFKHSNLIQHLWSKHIDDFKKYEEAQEKGAQNKESNQRKQITLEVTQDHVKTWSGSDPRAKKLTYRVAEMMALDCQPLSIVEDTRFLRLINEIEQVQLMSYYWWSILLDKHGDLKLHCWFHEWLHLCHQLPLSSKLTRANKCQSHIVASLI